jgi:hypothetical protein
MTAPNNYEVFLQALNRRSKVAPDVQSPEGAAPLGTEPLQPVLSTLFKFSTPVNVTTLASQAHVGITALVLSLQRLAADGVVELDTSRDEVSLTSLGRQMLNVGRELSRK